MYYINDLMRGDNYPDTGDMLGHLFLSGASIKYGVVITMLLQNHSKDAHTWPKCEARGMAVRVLIITPEVG
jgi:hypothetical protein